MGTNIRSSESPSYAMTKRMWIFFALSAFNCRDSAFSRHHRIGSTGSADIRSVLGMIFMQNSFSGLAGCRGIFTIYTLKCQANGLEIM